MKRRKNPLYASTVLGSRPLSSEQEDILSSSGLGEKKMSDVEKALWIGGAAVVAYQIFGQGSSYKQDQAIQRAEEITKSRNVTPISAAELLASIQSMIPTAYIPPPQVMPAAVVQQFAQHQAPQQAQKPLQVSSLKSKWETQQAQGGGNRQSQITGTSTRPPPKVWKPVAGVEDIQEDVIYTGASAVEALKEASGESSAFFQQAIVNPDQIVENTKKMSPLGLALALYSISWGYNLLFK